MRSGILALALLLIGCAPAPRDGFAAYVVNQDAHASAQAKPGKSYSVEPCTLEAGQGALALRCGATKAPNSLVLNVADGRAPSAVLGQTLKLAGGTVELDKTLALESGSITVQTLDGDVARGNFNARVAGQNPPWEVVGSFVARVKQ
jgi:hypothetical protein